MKIYMAVILKVNFFLTCFAVADSNICDIALTSGTFNERESSISENLVEAKRSDLCSKTYSSLQEAETTARNAGFSLGFKGLSIGNDKATKNSNDRWEISKTEFCNAYIEDFSKAYKSDYKEKIGGIALKSWEECIRNTNANKLFMTYKIDGSGRYFRGSLYKTANTGRLASQIEGISTVGQGKENVSCNIGGKKFTPETVLESPYEIKSTPIAVACEKGSDTNISITIQTSAGALDPIDLPSSKTIDQIKLESLQSEISLMSEELDHQAMEINSLSEEIKTLSLGQKLISYGEKKTSSSNEIKVEVQIPQQSLLIVSLQSFNPGVKQGKQHVVGVRSDIRFNDQICSREQSQLYVWDGSGSTSSICLKVVEEGSHKLSANVYPSTGASKITKSTLSYVFLPLRN